MRTTHGVVLVTLLSTACGLKPASDGGQELEPACPSDGGVDVFLGAWHAAGHARRTDEGQSPTWPASFAFRIEHAPNCVEYRFVDGDCALGLTPVFGTTAPTLREITGTTCSPGETTDFWFDGKKTPLAGLLAFTPADTTLSYASDGGAPTLTISAGGALSAEFSALVGFAGSATH